MVRHIKDSYPLALPEVAQRVLEVSRRPDYGPMETSEIIVADVGLTAQVLRFVNSSFFGFQHKITSIKNAMSLVYGSTIRNFILWNASFAVLPNPKCGPFELKKLSQDAVRRGVFAKLYAKCFEKQESEEIFWGSMFQDIAIPILAQVWNEEYSLLLTRREKERRSLSALENELFGWNHAHAGAFLAREWNYNELIANMIENHVTPNFDICPHGASPNDVCQAIVGLAGLLPSVCDNEWHEADMFFEIYHRLAVPGVPLPNVIFEQVESQVCEISEIVQLLPPSNNLIDFHKQWLVTQTYE